MLAGEDIESDEWLSMPHTSLDDLIRKMTALNPEKRFSSEDVFKYLSDKYPGTADILLKEKNTGSRSSDIQRSELRRREEGRKGR